MLSTLGEEFLTTMDVTPVEAQQAAAIESAEARAWADLYAAAPAAERGGRGLVVECVGPDDADEWAAFLQRVYRLETGRWLQALIGRPRWRQYIAREAGEIVAARGMYIGPDGTAWLGMDGPVPGVTTDDYEPDATICNVIVEDGLRLGARSFIADIEAPSETMDTPAYAYFARLG